MNEQSSQPNMQLLDGDEDVDLDDFEDEDFDEDKN